MSALPSAAGAPESLFHPVVAQWFQQAFARPTDAQAEGWPAIARGHDTLIAAPTGSGKTLAAFLWCLDDLVRRGLDGRLEDRCYVVYVSPLKALGNDVDKNLQRPLDGIRAVAEAGGLTLPVIRTAVRSGDTPASERQRMVRRPPHVLITTPESLYILLTARRSRAWLAGAQTVIVDEIHAVAGSKRGSHLALTLERLDALVRTEHPAPTRIGLSATQKPIERIGRLLVGAARPAPVVVDSGHSRPLDLAVEIPGDDEIGAVASQEQMAAVVDRIAALVVQHRTTLVFVNTRRLAERIAHALSERLGDDRVVSHHGSLSRKRRLSAEQRLKRAEVACCVATASLELGIDVGEVDLVVQIGSPRSIATFLQRVGRSGHSLGATPRGRIFALTRDQLVECAALVRAVRGGRLDRIVEPEAPLDILAQQLVACCAAEPWAVGNLYSLVRRATPYADLSRGAFDQVLEMLSDGITTRRGRAAAHLHLDRVNGQVKGRRGARLAAITGGGAIPDRGDYEVVAEPENVRVGTLDEDFAIESSAGDIFLLGNTAWQITRVESSTVRVVDAHGKPPNVPFWFGEAPARTAELCEEVSRLRADIAARLQAGQSARQVASWLSGECLLPAGGAEQAVAYVGAGLATLGTVPTRECVVAERFFDEAGGMQLVIHSPLGARINRAWGLALRKRFCVSFNFELQAAATDDGIVISLGPHHSFPLEAVFEFVRATTAAEVLQQAVLTGAPVFGVRWRWNVTRALAVLRFSGGRKVPFPLQRMRCDDLLAAVFPDQAACQENVHGPLEPPDHPLVTETLRDCMQEWMDLPGLIELCRRIETGAIRTVAVDSPEPSPFSHELLNANPYAFLDDAPLEERRTRAVTLRRGLPGLADDLGGLDPEAIARVAGDARPVVRDPDELHDALLSLCLLPVAGTGLWADHVGPLVAAGRAVRARWGAAGDAWVASERADLVRAALGTVAFEPEPPPIDGARPAPDATAGLTAIVRGHLECSGPVTAADLAGKLGIERADVDAAIHQLESEGAVLRGRFAGPGPDTEWCDRRILARIHRETLGRLRKAITPSSPAELMRFLFRWQHVAPGGRLHGREGLAEVVEQLQGVEVAAAGWEADVLPARLTGYEARWLDDLCLGGELVWGRLSPRQGASAPPTRAAPVALVVREDLPWLLGGGDGDGLELSPPARDVLDALAQRGASFASELQSATRRLACEVEDALWELVSAGLVTADGFASLRGLLERGRGDRQRPEWERNLRVIRRRRLSGRPRRAGGRWSLLRDMVVPQTDPDPDLEAEARAEAVARILLHRYGVVFRDLLARETGLPPWRHLLAVLRRFEASGQVRGGRFVTGFVGEQFALPEAVDALRAVRRRPDGEPEWVRLAAIDPLNLAGIVTPGPRVPAVLGGAVLYRDGVPVASLEGGKLVEREPLPPTHRLRSDLTVTPTGPAPVREQV